MKQCLVLLCCLFAIGTIYAANGKCGANVKWNLSDDGVLVISGKGAMKNFGGSLPYRPDKVRRVFIEDGVTSIGDNSFNNCKNLAEISIASTVTSIGKQAFQDCRTLPEVAIPDNVKTIGERAFKGCRLIQTIELPSGISEIGEECFKECTRLSYINVPRSVKILGKNSFLGCTSLKALIDLPKFVTAGSCQFYGLSANTVSAYWSKAGANQMFAEENSETVPIPIKKKNKIDELSDVDKYIPQTDKVSENTFVVIIANENYQKLAKVNYSLKDGMYFKEYCLHTLGIPEENIRTYCDATYGIMLEALSDIKNISKAYKGNIKVVFYYCGHGAPDETSKVSYLLPIDAYKVSANVCLSLNDLYTDLSQLNAKSVTVLLDACFSGATRDGEMLASARGTAIKPREETLSGNMVAFSASSGNETALQYDEKCHGMFTYYLLRKLQESKGEVSLGELCEYVTQKVLEKSTVINRKPQTPTLIASPAVGDRWRNWNMK